MTNAITVENLSKKYVIGHQRQEKYTALRDVMMHKLRAAGQRLRHPLSSNKEETSLEEFWALKDVSFEIKQGDRVGIIGRNGAGKSTLLKILTRITEPTTGRVIINGRVASLLEVGTGFHPELTGRENVFLNGAVLGMSRTDIKRKFDEIISFAEVEKFLDTPVKRYSSGMYVRLAFAVAAHLEPEILIVDEVLAVGDAEFQKKCLGKMEEVSCAGRTVVFVSHNMATVRKLCNRGILLQKGTIHYQGTQKETINNYLQRQEQLSVLPLSDRSDRFGTGAVRVKGIEFKGSNGQTLDKVASGQDFSIHMTYKRNTYVPPERICVAVMFKNFDDVPIFQHHNRLTRDVFVSIPVEGEFILNIPKCPLTASGYRMTFSVLMDGEYLDRIQDAIVLTVVDGDYYDTGETTPVAHGVCLVEGSWRVAMQS